MIVLYDLFFACGATSCFPAPIFNDVLASLWRMCAVFYMTFNISGR